MYTQLTVDHQLLVSWYAFDILFAVYQLLDICDVIVAAERKLCLSKQLITTAYSLFELRIVVSLTTLGL